MEERVIEFINSIRQQDMRTELLKTMWKTKGVGPIGEVSDRVYLTSLSFLLSSPGMSHPEMLRMYNEIDVIFNERTQNDIRAEAADIMHRHYPTRGNVLLDMLRDVLNIERDELIPNNEEVIRMIRRQEPATTPEQDQQRINDQREIQRVAELRVGKKIYDDSQNVHNTTINESVIASARALIEQMVATIIFDSRYKFNVFRDDTVKSITHRLADVLKKFPKDVTIHGHHDKQVLQSRMTYKLAENAKSTVECSRRAPCDAFKPEDVDKYMNVIGLNDYVFPSSVPREGENGRRLEEIFLVTNLYLNDIFEDKVEEELIFFLDLSGIDDAAMIWLTREDILKDLCAVIGDVKQIDEDVDDFIDEVFDDLFPTKNMNAFIKRVKTATVRDVKLIEILNAVWKFIHTKQGQTFTEMKKRLKEEILEAMTVCTSGIAAHFVSVIQGFFDDAEHPSFKIKMSVTDEIGAKLSQNINKLAMEKELDPVMDKNGFKTFVDTYIEDNMKDILSEFSDDDIHIKGISKKMITEVVYNIYILDDDDGT